MSAPEHPASCAARTLTLPRATCQQVPRSCKDRCSSQANPVVEISKHQIKMSKKREKQEQRAGVKARKRVAKAKGATQSPPPSPPFAASSSGSSLPLLLKVGTLTHITYFSHASRRRHARARPQATPPTAPPSRASHRA